LSREARPESRLVPHRAWAAAQAEVLRLAEQPGIIALLGAAGVGKTVLLNALAAQFRAQGQAPLQVACGDLLATPLPPLLLVDEADRIDETMLASLLREDGVAVLAALPSFAARLAGLPHRVVQLGGLLEEEVPAYVAARLAALHLPADRMAATALADLAEGSAGVPRRLNVLIGSSLFMAELEGAPQVRPEHVRAAAEMHALPDHVPPPEAPEPGRALMLLPGEASSTEPTGPAPDAAAPAATPAATPRRHRMRWIAAGLAGLATLGLALLPAGGPQPASSTAEAGPPEQPPQATLAAMPPPVQPAEAPQQVAFAALPPPVVPAADPPAPPPAAARPVPPLPDHPAPRFVLTYQRGNAAAAARASELAARLQRAGLTAGTPFPVSAGAESDRLRYFFPQDQATAQAAAAEAGLPGIATQRGEVAAGSPLPRPGTLEWIVSANPPLATQASRPASPAAAPPPPLPAPATRDPPDGAVLDAPAWPMTVELAWQAPEAAEAGCCVIELLGRAPDAGWQRIFAGTADAPGRHALPLSEPMDYAWRVLHIDRDGPRYAASPWSHFTLQPPAP